MKFDIPQEYKNKSGIYKIVNLVNGQMYIGSAKHLRKRYRSHIVDFKNNRNSPNLQNAWNKYGTDIFVNQLLEIVEDQNQLIEREQHYFNTLLFAQEYIKSNHKDRRFIEFGYNINPIAGSSLGMKSKLSTKKKKSRPVLCYDLDGNFLKRYYGITAAARVLKVDKTSILLGARRNGKRRVGNYRFLFATKEFPKNIGKYVEWHRTQEVTDRIMATKKRTGSINTGHHFTVVYDWLGYPIDTFSSIGKCARHFDVSCNVITNSNSVHRAVKGLYFQTFKNKFDSGLI